MNLIAEQLNFTYESTEEPTGEWGFELVDDTAVTFNANWSGVMGGVITGRFTIIYFSTLSMVYKRHCKNFNFEHPAKWTKYFQHFKKVR